MIDLAKAGIHPPDEMPFGVAWSTTRTQVRARLRRPSLGRPGRVEPRRLGAAPHGLPGRRTDRSAVDPRDAVLGLPHGPQRLLARPGLSGRGFGKEMRAAVLGFAFDGLGALSAETSAFLDNAASNGVTRSLGYEDNGISSSRPTGSRATPAGSG